jgi:glycerol-3-phosphate dehydrogenase (NAD(P)+)
MSLVTVLGAGMMGSAFCVPLVDRGHRVRLVGTPLDDAIVDCVARSHEHPTLHHPLPREIQALPVARVAEAMVDADIVVLGVSSAGVTWAAETLTRYGQPGVPVAMITKGLALDGDELAVLPDAIERALPPSLRSSVRPVAVAGPCIAGELARRVPTTVVFTGRDPAAVARVADACRTEYYLPFPSSDVVGVEVCAALKNAYAMGIALPAGMHEARGGSPGSIAHHNLESAVFAQAVVEMRAIVRALGGDPETVSGLSGVGDLDVTCNGGRTGKFGRLLGTGIGLAQARAALPGVTLECLEILDVMRRARSGLTRRGLAFDALPLLEALQAMALDDAPVRLPLDRFFGI